MAGAENERGDRAEVSVFPRALKAACGVLLALGLLTNGLIILQGTIEPVREVEGLSMWPSIKPEDGVLVVPVEERDIRPGQVVVFPDPEGYGQEVVHRVVGVEQTSSEVYLRTKGDNNPSPDPLPVPAGAVRGKVVLRLPGFGAFMDFARTPSGFFLCVLSPLLLFLLCCASESLEENRRREGSLGRLLTVPLARR